MAIHWAAQHAGLRLTRWIGVLFAIGSACFFIGPFPGFVDLVGAEADGMVFFVGSLFFTAAALLQALQARGGDRLPSLIQFAGTIFFNVSTFRAMQDAIKNSDVDRLIWAPEAAGSACFLISGIIAYHAVRSSAYAGHGNPEWRIAAINLAGCVLFGVSTIASYIVPSTGDVLNLAAANFTTSLGGLCFLLGALMMLPRRS
jgi:hypothetical protein